jgi:tight adherence protein B
MRLFVIGTIIFIVTITVIELLAYSIRSYRHPYRVKTRKRIKSLSSYRHRQESIDIVRNKALSHVPFLNKAFRSIPGIQTLDRLVLQAKVSYPPGFFILSAIVLCLTGFLVTNHIIKHSALALLVAASAGVSPFLYLRRKRRKRVEKFQRQLPDAMDLIARSLRAGHALTGGMKMVGDEFDDPLGPEFEETIEEINFGPSVADALKNLAGRINCTDLSFFVATVILQRETGGNLAEIVESLADLIRERFKFRGKIRTLSAEGRMTAGVLIAIPFFVAIAVFLLNPEYIKLLYTERAGRLIIGIAAFMMVTGIVIIRKMIKIEV